MITIVFYSGLTWAHQTCVNVQVGSNPIYQNNQVVGYEPIYNQECTWYYAAIAINPYTRKSAYAYNYTDIRAAENYVRNSCGADCIWMSTEDVAYIALSEDGGTYGTSRRSARDAIDTCGKNDCDWAIMTGTGDAAATHIFGGLSYSVSTGQGGQSWLNLAASWAKEGALKHCTASDCWAYAYDSEYAAMAVNPQGRLFAKGANSMGETVREAIKYCKQEGKTDTCDIVMLGKRFDTVTAEERDVTVKKALNANMVQRIFD